MSKEPKYYTQDLREVDFYTILNERLEYLYQELFKTHSDAISRELEALEKLRDDQANRNDL